MTKISQSRSIAPSSHASPGHFYLTKLLLPVLTATAKASPGAVRVVNMSSIVHYMGAREGIRWSTINNGDGAVAARKKLGMARLNGQSRLVGLRFRCYMTRDLNHCLKGNILFSNELARRYGGEGIVSISLFPGAVNADFSGYATSFVRRVRRIVGACIWFILSAGDLEALTEDMGPPHGCHGPHYHYHYPRCQYPRCQSRTKMHRVVCPSFLLRLSVRSPLCTPGLIPRRANLMARCVTRFSEIAPGIPAHWMCNIFSQVSHRLGSRHTST